MRYELEIGEHGNRTTYQKIVSIVALFHNNTTILQITHESGNISTVSIPSDVVWATKAPVEIKRI